MTSQSATRNRWDWIPGQDELPGGFLGLVDRVLVCLAAVGLAAISAILVVQVAARYVADQPTVWSEELSVSLFVWVAMIGIALATRRGEHLTIDLISKRFHGTGKNVLSVLLCALTVATFLLLSLDAPMGWGLVGRRDAEMPL